jgi:hypothetical protein
VTTPKPKVGDVLPADDKDKHLEEKQKANVKKLNDAFKAYQNGEHLSERNLLTITREFLFNSVIGLEYDEGFRKVSSAKTVEDFIQDSLLSLWEAIQRGGIRHYSGVVYKAAEWLNAGVVNYLAKERENRVGFEVYHPGNDYDGDGKGYSENLEIWRSGWYRKQRDAEEGTPFIMPLRVDDVDLDIMKLISSGSTQEEAAEILGVHVSSIQKRLSAMRKRNKEDETAKQARLAEKDEAYMAQYMARMAKLKPVKAKVMLDADESEDAA